MFSNDWDFVLKNIINSLEFKNFMEEIYSDYNKYIIFPKKEDIFKALKLTDFYDVKIVILGQDPYHGFGQANGLSFSVNKGVNLPPSLKNIFKEIKRDLNIDNQIGDLSYWANQGVLLLNSVLTVKEGKPKSYSSSFWVKFTDEIIKSLSNSGDVIFILWGNDAKKKLDLIDTGKNDVLLSVHPSPLSFYRGFLGCGHFGKSNEILRKNNKKEIDWRTI